MDPKIALLLGLAATASEQDVINAATQLKEERDALALKLGAAAERGDHLESRLSALEVEAKAKAAAVEAERVETRIRELRSVGAIPVAPDSGAEKVLRAAAGRGGMADFELAAVDFKPGTYSPVGSPMQLEIGKKADATLTPALLALADPLVKTALKANGLSDEDFIKYGPHSQAQNGGV